MRKRRFFKTLLGLFIAPTAFNSALVKAAPQSQQFERHQIIILSRKCAQSSPSGISSANALLLPPPGCRLIVNGVESKDNEVNIGDFIELKTNA